MRAVLFEGTPEEFARVEAMFRAGGDPPLQTRSIVLPQSRPKTWPELGEEHCYQLAKRVLERAPAGLVEALAALAEAQNLHGEQTIEDWASDANRLPDELCGMLAELGRCTSRAFIELFGCDRAPERVKGAAYLMLERFPSDLSPAPANPSVDASIVLCRSGRHARASPHGVERRSPLSISPDLAFAR